MKKVLAITLMLLLMATVAMAANQNSWRIIIKADNGVGGSAASGGYVGVYSTSVEGLDGQDGTAFTGIGADTPGTAMQVACVVPGQADIYSKSIKQPTRPNPVKTWDLFVAANVSSTANVIRLMAYDQSSTTLPVATFDSIPVKYYVVLLDNKGVEGAPINGTKWELPVPTAHSTSAYWTAPINLPVIKLSTKSNAALISEGYKIQFQQVVVPEPSSLLALGSGLIGLVGFVSRRRRA